MWEKYDKRKKLGMGNTAEVFLVQEKKTNFFIILFFILFLSF